MMAWSASTPVSGVTFFALTETLTEKAVSRC